MSETATDQQQSTTYHWIITAQTGDGRDVTTEGTYTAAPGHTRGNTFLAVLEHLAQKTGTPRNELIVMFFALEPDQL
jgi:hypothetical protein